MKYQLTVQCKNCTESITIIIDKLDFDYKVVCSNCFNQTTIKQLIEVVQKEEV